MKFGCCLNMIATEADGIGSEWLGAAAGAGFDYVELPLAETMALTRDTYSALKDTVIAASIPCEACNNFFPKTMRLTGADADIGKALAYAEEALERAGGMGAKTVVFGSGPAKRVPEGFQKQAAYEQIVKLLQDIGLLAAAHGITIAIEPLRKAECNIINTFEEGCRLAADVGRDNVRVLVDYYHLTEEREPIEHLLNEGAQWLTHVHFANPVGRVTPSVSDETDYRDFAKALKSIGYDGRASVEAYASDVVPALNAAMTLFRQRFGEED